MNLSIHPWIAWHYGGWLSTGFSPCVGVSYLADKGRGGKTTSGNGQAWSSASPEGSGEQGKMEKTGCKIICGAPTTLVVKELMMMMKSFGFLIRVDHKGLHHGLNVPSVAYLRRTQVIKP